MDIIDDGKKKSIPELSVETRLLYAKLLTVLPGELVPYADLNEEIGRDVQKAAYNSLDSARKRALHYDRILFETVKNVGLKRLTDTEIPDAVGESSRKHIQKHAKKAQKKLSCISNFQALSDSEKNKGYLYNSLFLMVEECMKPSRIKKLRTKCYESEKVLPLGKTLELFRS